MADAQTHADTVSRFASDIQYDVAAGSWLTAARHLRDMNEEIGNLAAEVCLAAAREGVTQKDLAAALGLSPRDLTGLRKEAQGAARSEG